MDVADIEEHLCSVSDAKLHGDMCRMLSVIYCKVLSIFPTLEAARPRSRSGIQALCSLHLALEKVKNILQHCCDCSKLYLAVTAESVLLKFDKAKCALIDSLKRVEDIVPQSIGSQTQEIVCELEGTMFSLNPLEKQVGNDIIRLLQLGGKFGSCRDNNELESFLQAATKLGINSSRAVLTERRALKKLIERARVEEDKRKESIVAYLLHLMRKYSKLFRTEISDDNDSQGSAPCSPTVQGSSLEYEGHGRGCQAFDRQLSKLSSFNFKARHRRSWHMPLPPEEFRCPISLQLMYDPVIIASGQTYERMCIEKWFSDGHSTCPKTQQKLPHLCLTPNYSVKGLVASWCEQNGVPIPGGPPESLDLNYWRLAISKSESTNSRSMHSVGSVQSKEAKVVPLQNHIIEEAEGNETVITYFLEEDSDNLFERYQDLLHVLDGEEDLRKKSKVVKHLRFLLKDDDEARYFMGANGFIEVLLRYLELALHEKNVVAQENGTMALFNLTVNNNRNKEMMLAAGVATLLEGMIQISDSHAPATALYLNLTCLEEAKPIIGSTQAVPFLIQKLQAGSDPQIKQDAVHALYNLSTYPPNVSNLLEAGIISGLHSLLSLHNDNSCTEKCIAVLINLASSQSGRDELVSSPSLISALASILDVGELIEQEQAVSCLLILCNASEKCSQLVLQEGVIPALVSISVSGTTRGIEKSQKLLMLFRQQRQRDQSFANTHQQAGSDDSKPPSKAQTRSYLRSATKAYLRTENDDFIMSSPESKPFCKSASKRKVGRALSFLWKSKSYSMYQC